MSFSKKTLDFLFENRLHDSKSWYQEHKADYRQYVAEPFSKFITDLQPTIKEIDSQLVCDPKKISRLYRDARFSKGESIFRDNMWCSFSRTNELYESLPAFYFDFSPKGFDYGCGYYKASAASMNAIRTLILENDKSFQRALKAYESQNTFLLAGDFYKKNRYPEQNEKLYNWLNRKTIYLFCTCADIDLFCSDNFSEKIAEDFRKIAPVYNFFIKAEEYVVKAVKSVCEI